MTPTLEDLIAELIESGYCWHLSCYQSLEPDPEAPDFKPEDHFCCSIITSYEDEVKGWGPDAGMAMRRAIAAYDATLVEIKA